MTVHEFSFPKPPEELDPLYNAANPVEVLEIAGDIIARSPANKQAALLESPHFLHPTLAALQDMDQHTEQAARDLVNRFAVKNREAAKECFLAQNI